MQLKEWGTWCLQQFAHATLHMSCTWTSMGSLCPSLTGHFSWQPSRFGQAFRLPTIQWISEKILCRHQIVQSIFKQDIIFCTLFALYATSLSAQSIGLCLEPSSKRFTESMRIMDGADPFIWKWFIHFQGQHASLMLYAQTAFLRRIIGSSLLIWLSSMEDSPGYTSYGLVFNNIHS